MANIHQNHDETHKWTNSLFVSIKIFSITTLGTKNRLRLIVRISKFVWIWPKGIWNKKCDKINTNSRGLLVVAWLHPHVLDHPKSLWKNNSFYKVKVHNELGKVVKLEISKPQFLWRNSSLKKVQAQSPPPTTTNIRVKWIMDTKINF